MEIFAPEYYEKFHCLASVCPDSCCKEWEIDVDEAAASFYRSLPGELGDQLRKVLRESDGSNVMTITDGRCPMWRQDGLCRIQAELGHDALCEVCREYPRLRHDYGTFVELGLEMSCPEAARLIFAGSAEWSCRRKVNTEEAAEYDAEVMNTLLRSRGEMLDLLCCADYSLPQMLAIMLLYGYLVQSEIDGGACAVLEAEVCLKEAQGYTQAGDMEAVFSFFEELEILTPQWKALLARRDVSCGWSEALRSLVRYGIERYWLQAVSDYDLMCRVKFIIIMCLLVNALGGDPVSMAQLFSKEIENNQDSVEAIFDSVYTCKAFTDARLLGLLMLDAQK